MSIALNLASTNYRGINEQWGFYVRDIIQIAETVIRNTDQLTQAPIRQLGPHPLTLLAVANAVSPAFLLGALLALYGRPSIFRTNFALN